MYYVSLKVGRSDPEQEMTDMAIEGPVIGPFNLVRLVYGNLQGIKKDGQLFFFDTVDNMIKFWFVYYSDVVILTEEEVNREPRLKEKIISVD